MPVGVMLLILVPFLIVGLYFQNRKYNALSANPVFTSTVVSDVYGIRNGSYLKYQIFVDGKAYDGGAPSRGLSVGDSIGVVYQKDNPENNMTVFEYYDGPEFGAVIIFVIVAIVLAVYRWLKINRKYNDRCTELNRSGRCMIYRTEKEYIFVTVYYVGIFR